MQKWHLRLESFGKSTLNVRLSVYIYISFQFEAYQPLIYLEKNDNHLQLANLAQGQPFLKNDSRCFGLSGKF